jgi:hypothetical protein
MTNNDWSDYSSSWDWTTDRSKYHFDYTKHDVPGEWFTPLGRFVGDWKDELDVLVNQSHHVTINWSNRRDYRDKKTGELMQLKQELNDLHDTGLPDSHELTDRYDFLEDFPTLHKISQYFEMQDRLFRTVVHLQKPGQMFNLHIDKFWDKLEGNDKPEDIVRIMVFLDDWKPGHFYTMGTYTYTHWKAGDCFMFDWPNLPHATANASRWVRPLLMITGFQTAETRKILANSNVTTRHKV